MGSTCPECCGDAEIFLLHGAEICYYTNLPAGSLSACESVYLQ